MAFVAKIFIDFFLATNRFFDHNYHENLAAMFKKVNAKEKIIGWYSTGPKIKPQDIQINELFRKYSKLHNKKST